MLINAPMWLSATFEAAFYVIPVPQRYKSNSRLYCKDMAHSLKDKARLSFASGGYRRWHNVCFNK